MIRKSFGVLAAALWLSVAVAGQAQEDYLDVFTIKVKPEKRADFDLICKRMADANRRHKDDTWLTLETAYGGGNTVVFVSSRRNYGDVDKAYGAFMGALNKAYGPAAASKVLQDFNNCALASRAEFRRVRWDLSVNPPADGAARNKLVGEARWVHTVIVRVRPGQVLNFEEQLRAMKAAREKAAPQSTTIVSQALVGQQDTVFYIASFRSSLGGFDADPPLSKLMGEEGYEKFLKTVSESVAARETVISRFLPELSNPPEEIVSVAPEFWRPKAAAAAKP